MKGELRSKPWGPRILQGVNKIDPMEDTGIGWLESRENRQVKVSIIYFYCYSLFIEGSKRYSPPSIPQ